MKIFSNILFAVIALIVQVIVTILFLNGFHTTAFLLHGVATAVLFILYRIKPEATRLLIVLMSAFAGIFGIIAFFLAKIIELGVRRSQKITVGAWLEQFLEVETPPQRLLRRLQQGQENLLETSDAPMPLYRIFMHGDTVEKRKVLSQIAEHHSPAFAPILQLALSDIDNGIRVYAVSIIMNLEKEFMAKILPLEKSLNTFPDNPDVQLALANEYDAYAYSGILEENRVTELRIRTIDLLSGYYIRQQKNLSAYQQEAVCRRIARLQLRIGRAADAEKLLYPLLEDRREDMPGGLLLWYLESLFQQRSITKLRNACLRYGNTINPNSLQYRRAKEVIEYWTQERGHRHATS